MLEISRQNLQPISGLGPFSSVSHQVALENIEIGSSGAFLAFQISILMEKWRDLLKVGEKLKNKICLRLEAKIFNRFPVWGHFPVWPIKLHWKISKSAAPVLSWPFKSHS